MSLSGCLSSLFVTWAAGFPLWWPTLLCVCRMLYDYVERKRKENSGAQLHVTYLVAGNLLQNGHVVSVSLLPGA